MPPSPALPGPLARYGPWAVVAGASEGLGAAFAEALAAQGLHLILLARRADLLEAFAQRLRAARGVEVRTLACDLGDAAFTDRLGEELAGREVGVAVYNAAYSFLAPLLARPLEESLRVVDVNIRGTLRFVHAVVPPMVARRRGALVLMSSVAGFQGVPRLAAYSSSKAFLTTLAEGLWAELGPQGVDVVACCAGAIRTPGYAQALRKEAPGTLDAAEVAEAALRALGSGPVVVPGAVNKLATFFLRRLATRRRAISILGGSVAGLE